MQKSYHPQNENWTPHKGQFNPVASVKVLGAHWIEIERVAGAYEFVWQGRTMTGKVRRTIRYERASKHSRERLHKVCQKLVNDNQAVINLHDSCYIIEF